MVFEDEYGLTFTSFLKLPLKSGIQDTGYFNLIPFWNLNNILIPLNNNYKNEDFCGYWFLPYEYFEFSQSLYEDLTKVIDLPIKFSINSLKNINKFKKKMNFNREYINK